MTHFRHIRLTPREFADLFAAHMDQRSAQIPFDRAKLAIALALLPIARLRVYILVLMGLGYALLRALEAAIMV